MNEQNQNEQNPRTVVTVSRKDGVLTVTLNRPQVHNAMNPRLIADLTAIFREIGQMQDVRLVILTGSGRSFCAGADLASMRAAADYDFQQNMADGQAIYDLMLALDRCPRPVVGRVNGAAIGGGIGLICCCDSVVAVARARFAFSEVRLGLLPAVISPFVLNKIGASYARELFLTGARFDAAKAYHIGLVHHVVAEEDLDQAVAEQVEMLLAGAPGAQAEIKELLRRIEKTAPEQQRAYTAELLAQRRASEEGREGMTAFLQKRPPSWQTKMEN